MIVEFPQIDQIMHASLDENAYSQREYVKLMNQSNNFINLAFQDLLDRISREYNDKSILDILNMVSKIIYEENIECKAHKIIYDDFIKNAAIVSQSLKKIINMPSRKLVKIDKNVTVNKVTRFDSKTMTWLSRRQGISIEEKISPRNVIPTKVTYFTADTMENRHTMYLFDILYDYLYDKVYPKGEELPCEQCVYKERKCYLLYDKLKTILFLKHTINITDLKNVPKEKQLRQNNKLMSDKEYKQIWDAVRDIDYYEQNCKNIWDHLEERYQFMIFLLVCANIYNFEGMSVFDTYSTLVDKDGKIKIKNEDKSENIIKFYNDKSDCEIIVLLINNNIEIKIYKYISKDGVSFDKKILFEEKIDLSNIFNVLSDIKEKEIQLSILENEIDNYHKTLVEIKLELEEFYDKKPIIQYLAKIIQMHIKEDVLSGKEEKQREKN